MTPPKLTEESAVREVGWVAREARELVGLDWSAAENTARLREFFDRKAALLRYIGDEDLAAKAESQAAAFAPGGAYWSAR
jgi:hypothetical protein